MFATKAIQRYLHTASVNYVRRKANPGIGIQTQVFKREGLDQPQNAVENYDDMESDFMEIHKTHKQYEEEIDEYREKMRHWIVKNKYFKQKLPNFLTYSEKEQIKLLHARDPEEWSVEKLSESFPANQQIIHKIITSKWVPKSAKRIRKHNATVIENWEKLQKGEFPELNSVFREHLMKFAIRKPEDSEQISTNWKKQELPKPSKTEFLSLITSCRPYADKEPTQKMLSDSQIERKGKPAIAPPDEEETYLSEKVKDKRSMRFQELKTLKLKGDVLAAAPENPSGTGVVSKISTFGLEKYASNEIVVSATDMKKFEISKVKDRIYIPRKLRKEGATYKVEDCYYDDDGEFLYRVPGMTGEAS